VTGRNGRRWLPAALVGFAVACSGESRTSLVVYSPHGKDLLQYYERAFEQSHPNVDVQ